MIRTPEDQIREAIRQTQSVAQTAEEREAIKRLAEVISNDACRLLRNLLR